MAENQPLDSEALRAANINPVTGLATDYLNHYNEVAMLVSMLGDMPDMAEEILDWGPVDYPAHFINTGYREKDMAIAAWEQAPCDARDRFQDACSNVEGVIGDIQRSLVERPEMAPELVPEAARIFDLIAKVGGVINGDAESVNQSVASVSPIAQSAPDQADIDALFD